jgi:hypothetical protein
LEESSGRPLAVINLLPPRQFAGDSIARKHRHSALACKTMIEHNEKSSWNNSPAT